MEKIYSIIKTCLPLVLIAVILIAGITSIGNLSKGSRNEERQHLEDALRRAALSCYAAKGYYPPDLEYITSKYGIQIDKENFAVFYEVFAENIMPSINVVEKHE